MAIKPFRDIWAPWHSFRSTPRKTLIHVLTSDTLLMVPAARYAPCRPIWPWVSLCATGTPPGTLTSRTRGNPARGTASALLYTLAEAAASLREDSTLSA